MPNLIEIDPATVAQWIASGEAYAVDVREEEEWEEERIEGTHLSPLSELDVEDFEAPENKRLVLICAKGMRSARAGSQLLANGWEEVYNMTGGLAAWREAGLPLWESD